MRDISPTQTLLVLLLIGLLAIRIFSQTTTFDLRDQVLYNTARIDNLISGLETLSRTGSNTVQLLSIQTNTNSQRIAELEKKYQELHEQFYNFFIYAFLQAVAVATFGVKYWIRSKERSRRGDS